MKKLAKLIVALLIVAVMFGPSVTVMATGNITQADYDALKQQLDAQREANMQLREDLLSLQGQLQQQNNQPSAPASTPRPSAPRVKLLSPQTISMNQNETLDVEITVKNIGTSSASSVLTQVSPGGEAPIVAEFLNSSNSVSNIAENGTQVMKLRITTDATAEPGTYKLELSHSFKNRNAENLNESDTLYVRIGGKAQTPNIMLRDFRVDKTNLTPGDTFTLTATIENMGEGDASEVQTSLDKLDTERLYLTSDLNAAYFSDMKGKYTGQLRFTFALTALAKSGVYPVNFKLTYRDSAGKTYENTYTYYVNVSAASAGNKPLIEIRDLTEPSGAVNVDQTALITMQVFNSGATPATNVKITATPIDKDVLMPKSASIQQISTLSAGTGKVISFSFAPTADAKSRSYMVGFNIEYETGYDLPEGDAEIFTFEQYAAVNVNNPDEADAENEKFNKPKMIVSEYAVDPQIVRAGREFDLQLTFQNASSLKAVNNIKITLTAVETTERKGSVFTPVGGSNTFYIDEIAAKGTETRTLRMYTVPDADPRTYNISVNFSYQDEDFNDYEEHEQISINVKQVTRLETSEPYIPESVPVFQQVYLNCNIINSGRVSLSNLRVRIDGNFDTTNADIYIGNMGKGNTFYYDGFITATEAGLQEGSMVVYGEDDTGELIEYVRPFTINVTEMSFDESMMGGDQMMGDMSRPGLEGMPEEPTSLWGKIWQFIKKPIFWGPAAGLAVVAVIVIVVLVRRKNKRIDFDE